MMDSHRSDSLPFLILAVEIRGRRLCLNCASLADQQDGIAIRAGDEAAELAQCDDCGAPFRHARSFGEWHEDNWGYR